MHRIYHIEFEQTAKQYIDKYWTAREAGNKLDAARIGLELALYRARYWDQFLEAVHMPHQEVFEEESYMAWLGVGAARDVLEDLQEGA